MAWPVSARFADVIRGSHQAAVRATLCTTHQFGPSPTGTDLPILGGSVQLASTADIKGTLDLVIPGIYYDESLPLGPEIFVERGIDFGDGTRELTPIGYFRIEDIDQDAAPRGNVQIDAYTREAQMIDNRAVLPYQVVAGATHRSILNDLVNGFVDAEGQRVVYPLFADAVVPIDWTAAGYDPDTATVAEGQVIEDGDTYSFLTDMLNGRGCILRFKPTGELEIVRRDGGELAAGQIAVAAAAVLDRVQGVEEYFEDLTWRGAPDAVNIWNGTLIDGFLAAYPGSDFTGGVGGNGWGPNLVSFLTAVIDGDRPLAPSLYTIRGGPTGTLVRARRGVSRKGVYNVTRAIGSDTDVQTGFQFARISDPANPLRFDGPFGAVVRFFASPQLDSVEAAQKAATSVQARVTGLPRNASYFVVPNPALRPLDPVSSMLTGTGQLLERHIIDSTSIPLVGDSPPEIVTRAVHSLADVASDDPNIPDYPDPTDPTDPGPVDPGPGTDPGTGPADPTDGTQAAVVFNWGAITDGDEFNYTGRPDSSKWGLYDGAGHDGNGRRSPSAFSVADGIMNIRGENNTTGGTAFRYGDYGYRVEVRAAMPSGSGGGAKFHPVLILWPDNDDWPGGAEYDYFETDEGTGHYGGFMHLPNHTPYRQDQFGFDADIEGFHNYACEWDPRAQTLRAYRDGVMTYEGRGRVAQAPGPMHLTIQHDNFGGNPRASTFRIAWVRCYRKPNA